VTDTDILEGKFTTTVIFFLTIFLNDGIEWDVVGCRKSIPFITANHEGEENFTLSPSSLHHKNNVI